MRLLASASIAALWSTPTARAARGREQFEHPPRAGAEVEQVAVGLAADHREQRRLDPLLRRMQRTDRVPVGCSLGEIGRRLPAPGLARDLEPAPVGAEGWVGGVEAANQIARKGAALVGETEERPGALAAADGQAGFDQELQMARDAGLRLAEDGCELADRQLRLLEQTEDAQPRLLARRLEIGEQRGKRDGLRWETILRHKHIFMSNPPTAQEAIRRRSYSECRAPDAAVPVLTTLRAVRPRSEAVQKTISDRAFSES